ncbi:unnamed protein product [Chrysodeixis includens]|uniref:Major facilitator superfamily (MFS) profile domain-containing protein n=1 Tax=Chrysodeixis includens TaxID=689277 RepID=A0A9P0FZR3_CHRIL|nr:unnamed protein product [Chrysodeixis includens]
MKYKINYGIYTVQDKFTEKKKEKAVETYDDDYLVKSIGAFGRWQGVACATAAVSRLIAMWNIHSILFLTPSTDFVCQTMKDNKIAVPANSTCYDSCTRYKYKEEVFEKTLISQFDLICGNGWMASFTQTVLMFGVVIGLSVFGWISDRFGRRIALIISPILAVIFMVSSSFTSSFWIFTTLRFFVGVASGGIMSITSVYVLELVGPQYRELAGTLILIPDALAEATLSVFAYLSPTWNIYILALSVASIIITFTQFFLPETPRWLVARRMADKAVVVMTKAAKFNNRSTTDIQDNVTKIQQELQLKTESKAVNYLDLFKTRRLSIITLSSFAAWFVTGVCYFGINQYITVLGPNIFIVVAAMGVLQIPMAPMAAVITKVFKRKTAVIGTYVSIGVTMIILVCVPKGSWVASMFGVIGVCFAFINFSIMYLYVTELYPTPIRNMGFSLSSSGSKIGAMVAPFVANMNSTWIASVIFAVLPVMAVAICTFLPETKGSKLRDTVDE